MKIILVTGASSGMGREAMVQLSDRFGSIDEIWAVARRTERIAELSGSLTARVRTFGLDLTDPAAADVLGGALEREKPQVLFLVNAAGFGILGPVEKQEKAREQEMIRLNCEALCAVTRVVLPYMAKNGRILQFASAAAFLPQPGFAVYAATKAFVLSYSRALNMELRERGIRVTAVCPGPVDTEFFGIAEVHEKAPLYKRLFLAKPRRVVKKAVRDSMAGLAVSVYSLPMQLFWALTKLLPHDLLLKIAFGQKSFT